MDLTNKQTIAIDYLEDKITREILFGGSAGGGKSVLGCYWQLKRRLKHPNTRGLIGRSRLKDLKDTTLMTFFEVARLQGVDNQFTYNAQTNRINFTNGSVIFLKDLFHYPSDPDFVGLGSLEITDAFIDEGGDVVEKAVNILRTRIRFNLIDGLPKLMVGANPAKNWLYREFYKPYRDGVLPDDRKFIPSTARENKYIPDEYIKSLDNLKGVDRERLRDGNWDYADDDTALLSYDEIIDMFGFEYAQRGIKYISADIATYGADLMVIGIWDGLQLTDIITREKSGGDEILTLLQTYAKQYDVPLRNIVYDADGVGSFLAGFLRRSYRFNNGSSPLQPKKRQQIRHAVKTFEPQPFANLKTQCAYKLAELIQNGEIGVTNSRTLDKYKDRIISEFQQLKRDKIDNDSKLYILSKEVMKENLGHSPDFLDMFIMRMVFEVANV